MALKEGNKANIANAAAQKFGFASAKYNKRWRNFDVFECVNSNVTMGVIPIVGLPTFVLIDNNDKPHIANADEVCNILGLEVVNNPDGENL